MSSVWMRVVAALALLTTGCGRSSLSELGPERVDLSSPRDLGAAGDLSALDFATPKDGGLGGDLLSGIDLHQADAASIADLAVTGDLALVPLTVTPSAITVPTHQQQIFVANRSVTWHVLEPGGGSVGADGTYVAPSVAGIYHLVAEGTDGATATATITVRALIVSLFAGQLGGWGGRDGIGTFARFAAPMGAVADGAGTLYVADSNNACIRKVVIATGEVTTLAGVLGQADHVDGVGASARFWHPWSLVYDAARSALYVADPTDETIRRVSLPDGTVTTIAGKTLTMGNANGGGASARFRYPKGIAFDGANTLFVADADNSLIRSIDLVTNTVSTLAGTGTYGYTDGFGTSASFDNPVALTYDAGNLYVADAWARTIRKIVVQTAEVTTFAGKAGFFGANDGVGPAARFREPSGIVADGNGRLYVSDAGLLRVRVIDIGAMFGTVGPLVGGATSAIADGIGAAAGFRRPTGLALDGGVLWVADSTNSLVRRVQLDTLSVTSPLGLPPHIGATDGAATGATFYVPNGLAADENDTVYVTELLNQTVRKIEGGVVALFAGSPKLMGSTNGIGGVARFQAPQGIVSDHAGSLFVAQRSGALRQIAVATAGVTSPFVGADNGVDVVKVGDSLFVSHASANNIRRVSLTTGTVSVFAGDPGGQYGALDGLGTAARFTQPGALSTDGLDHVFVADWYGQTIRQITLSTGEVKTIAGAAAQYGHVDGIGDATRLSTASALAWDGAGSLYVAERGYHTVRRLHVASRALSTYAGVAGTQVIALGPLEQATLNTPIAMTVLSDGTLLIASHEEHCILAVH